MNIEGNQHNPENNGSGKREKEPGTLVVIGGAVRLDGDILREFYQRSGGADGRIVILPTASAREEGGIEYIDAFAALGLRCQAQILPVRTREDANQPEFVNAVREATGIFISGGHQARLVSILGGTLLHKAIIELYQRGYCVGGTSAGAAALSAVMIAFGHQGMLPRPHIAQFSSGLGLIDICIFDQHFRQRNRIGRLLYAVACNPSLLGIGIDEDTAVVIQGSSLTVLGAGAVTIVDGLSITSSDIGEMPPKKLVSMSGVQLHILTAGSTFNLEKRTASTPEPPPVLVGGQS